LALQSSAHAGVRASAAYRPRWARTPRPALVCRSAHCGTPLRRTAFLPHSPGPTRRARIGRSRRAADNTVRPVALPPYSIRAHHHVVPRAAIVSCLTWEPPRCTAPSRAFKSRPPSHAQGALAEPPPAPWTPTRSSTFRPSSPPNRVILHPLGLPVAPTLACCPAQAAGSPESNLQRPPPPASAVPARRPPLCRE
jgi:hypothetical protein